MATQNETRKVLKPINSIDRALHKLFGETEQQFAAREMSHMFEQIYSLRRLRGQHPPFVRLNNRLATEDFPGNDATTSNTLILSTSPLVNKAGDRTYVAWIDKLHTFVGYTFTNKGKKTETELNIETIISDIFKGNRPESMKTRKRDVFDSSKTNMWDPATYNFPITASSLHEMGNCLRIKQAKPVEFLKSIRNHFDLQDPADIEHHNAVADLVAKLVPKTLGKLKETGGQVEVGSMW